MELVDSTIFDIFYENKKIYMILFINNEPVIEKRINN